MASIGNKTFDIFECLLPNGTLVPITCTADLTVKQLKGEKT